MEDIYTYVETLQHLADLAWPFMDYNAKGEMVIDQFLRGMGNHELSVQVSAHGHRRMEYILRVAQLLEAVQEDEKFRPRGHKPNTQERFVTDERDHSPDTKQLVRTCWHISVETLSLVRVCGNDHLPMGPSELGVQTRRALSLLPIPPHVHHPGKFGAADFLLQKADAEVEICHCSVTTVKGMAISPRTVHLRISIR